MFSTFYFEIDSDVYVRRHYFYKYLLHGTWLLMTTVLTYSYTTTLTSYLTVPLKESMPTTFDELAARPDLKPVAEFDYLLTQKILVGWG